MLKAKLLGGNYVYAWEVERGPLYFCPECNGSVVLKKGAVKVAHFAHSSEGNCSYTQGESWEHLCMKENMIKALRKSYPAEQIDSEISAIPGRRADIILKLPGVHMAIECQVSPMTVTELRQRTLDYLNAGYNIQWIFHLSRIKRSGFYDKVGAVRIPEEIRFLDTKRIPLYFMDDDGRIRACELKYKWARGSAMYTETTCFCNFRKVRMWEFLGGFPDA